MKKNIVFLILFIFIGILSGNTQAATITWQGGGSDSLASTSENWSGNKAPQNGDDIVFDDPLSGYCTWDLTVTLASLTRTSAYTGEITKEIESTLVIAKVVTWQGGNGNSALNPLNWSTGEVPVDGDKVIFNDLSSDDVTWDIPNITPALFSVSSDYTGTISVNVDISISGSLTVAGGNLNLNNQIINVGGYLLIGPEGTINAGSSTIDVMGDWVNLGTFIPGDSTVILSGINQTIYGDTTFYNLIKTVTFADTLYFQIDSTQTVRNSLVLQGTNGNLLSLRSTEDESQWYINPYGSRNISFTSIKDMNNKNFVDVVPLNSEDAGNNNSTSFGGSECVCVDGEFKVTEAVRVERRVS